MAVTVVSIYLAVQIRFATQGGSDTRVPELSIEVDDIEVALKRVRKAGLPDKYVRQDASSSPLPWHTDIRF